MYCVYYERHALSISQLSFSFSKPFRHHYLNYHERYRMARTPPWHYSHRTTLVVEPSTAHIQTFVWNLTNG